MYVDGDGACTLLKILAPGLTRRVKKIEKLDDSFSRILAVYRNDYSPDVQDHEDERASPLDRRGIFFPPAVGGQM